MHVPNTQRVAGVWRSKCSIAHQAMPIGHLAMHNVYCGIMATVQVCIKCLCASTLIRSIDCWPQSLQSATIITTASRAVLQTLQLLLNVSGANGLTSICNKRPRVYLLAAHH
jgi:hypothetical protein